MQHRIVILMLAVIVGSPAGVTAQNDGPSTCPAIVETAYAITLESCAETGRDEACYGHAAIQAAPDTLAFSAPGDVAQVTEIDGLRLSGMDLDAAEWGIALLRVQANLSDDTPENVEIVLFGDVEIAAAEDADPEADPEYGPMQAFTFRSGIDDAPCAVAPSSGILIQTPQGVGEITLLVNEAVIELGSTAYLQAQPDDVMTVRVIEGQAKITAGDETVTVPAGAETTIPLDEEGIASGVPTPPGPYDITLVEALPVSLLSVPVEIALPASGERSENEPGDACAVTPGGESPINQRGGPGTNYPVVGQLAPGAVANPDGQATGADGYTWWRLGEGAWVRGDVVLSAGACGSLPQVKAPPPPVEQPALAVSAPSSGSAGFDVGACESGEQQVVGIRAGWQVSIWQGWRWPTLDEALAGKAAGGGIITLDGVSLPVVYYADPEWIEGDRHGPGYSVAFQANWIATPGTHVAYSAWFSPPHTCVFTVQP